MAARDPLAALLDGAEASSGGQPLKVDALFGKRPEVLDSIRAARGRDTPLSHRRIAELLSSEAERVSAAAVVGWCKRHGVA